LQSKLKGSVLSKNTPCAIVFKRLETDDSNNQIRAFVGTTASEENGHLQKKKRFMIVGSLVVRLEWFYLT